VKLAAAKLYGQGMKRPEIARILQDYLAPQAAPGKKLRRARLKLQRWWTEDEFRDLVWRHAVMELEGEQPAILQGVARKARQGRVDAARLVFELTGRHLPKGEPAAPSIAVVIGMPRPEGSNPVVEAVKALQPPDDDDEEV
jgi:hypothetical protein